jgi:hypothetical protein
MSCSKNSRAHDYTVPVHRDAALELQRLFWQGADKVAKLLKRLLLAATLFAGAMAVAQQASHPTQLEFHSSNSSLDEIFRLAPGQSLVYVAPSPSSIDPW